MNAAAPLDIREELVSTPYEHVRALARGGMGEVHVVLHRALREERVLKVVRDLGADTAELLAKRMIAEGRLLRGLRHVNVVETLDLGLTKGGKPYLVTEFLSGCTLKEEVDQRGPLGAAEVIDVLEAILQGIQAAHETGIVHRDLKPLNVFYAVQPKSVRPDGRCIKIIDFGIAKVLSQQAKDRAGSALVATTVGWAIGSPSYMPPEQVLGQAVDGRADLYAIGCIGCFLLTGRPPFGGRTQEEIMGNQLTQPAPSLYPTIAGVPETLSAVLEQALAKRPEDRFTTAAVMRAALVRARNELHSVANPTQPLAPAANENAANPANPAKAAPEIAAALAPLEPVKPAQALLGQRGTVRMEAAPVRTSSAADVDTIFRPPQKEEELLGDTTPDPGAAARVREAIAEARSPALVPAPRTKRVPERSQPGAGRLRPWLLAGLALAVVALVFLLLMRLG